MPRRRRFIRQVLVQQPNQADALHLLGVLEFGRGRFDIAIDLMGRAIGARPNFLEARVNLGTAYLQAGKLEQAIDAFQRAIGINGNVAGIFNNLGNALQAAGKTDKAIGAYQRAIDLDPSIADVHYNLGNVQSGTRQAEAAIGCYRRAIGLRPDHVAAYGQLAVALLRRGDVDQALANARKGVAFGPNSAEPYNCLVAVLRAQGKLEEAITACARAIALKPDYAEAHRNLGIVLTDDGRFEEAVAAYRKAIELDPNVAEVHSNLGITLKFWGRIDEAIAACRRAVELKPNSVQAKSDLRDVLRGKGYVDKATIEFKQEVAFVPDLAEAGCSLGNVVKESRGPNLVFGMAWNLRVKDVRAFVESLRRYYQGDVMMLVTSQGSGELVEYLQANGIIPVYFDAQIWMGLDVMAGRFVRYGEILCGAGKEYEHVLLTDVTDVLFQGDPFGNLPEGELLCFLEGRGMTFAESPLNAYWVREVSGAMHWIKSRTAKCPAPERQLVHTRRSCSTSIACWKRSSPRMFKKLPKCNLGYDQGIHNFLLLNGQLPNSRILPNGQHVYTLALVKLSEIGLGPDGTILAPDGSLCPIVHQYNFKPQLSEHLRKAHPALNL